jgi:hypothetical protein
MLDKSKLLLLNSEEAHNQWWNMYNIDGEAPDHHMLFNGHEFSIILEIDPRDRYSFNVDPYIKLCSADNVEAAVWDKSIGVSKITLLNPRILYNDDRYTQIVFNKKVLRDLNEAFMNYKILYNSSYYTLFEAVKLFMRYDCYNMEVAHKDSIDFTVIDNYKEYYGNIAKIYSEPWEE